MSYLQTFQVSPAIPEPLSFLEVLSRNLWWSWQHEALELFRRIDPQRWDDANRNPIAFLTYISQNRFEELKEDESFLAHLQHVKELFQNQVLTPVDRSDSPFGPKGTIAYFSMEFGIHESLPLFAGGLGVLAGDHLKSASDMALPLTGIGLLYRKGYFHQFLNRDGWQQEEYPETNLYHLPLRRARNRSGDDVYISIMGPDGKINALVWQVMVGRIPLYLLDTNLTINPPEIRDITSNLYTGEQKMRLAQEVLLGIGGMRALEAIGICPVVSHMNEGHSAFSNIERLAQIMSVYKVDLNTAMEIGPRSTIFTTHTPVAAGHDEFPADLVRPYLIPLEERLGVKVDQILSLGQPIIGSGGPFSMFILGLRMAQYCNGVSRLHGKVARRMWSNVWPGRPETEIPISHITNGVHVPSWVSLEISQLFGRYLDPEWRLHPWNPNIIKRIDEIYDEELWRAHEMNRFGLIRACRKMMVKQYARRNAPKTMINDAKSVLDQDVLTIAFARRFATYKRANLLLNDPERFESILNSETYPVQFIFAGKAHPKDNEGKEMIRRIVQFARRPSARRRIIFLENYDIHMARRLLQGADVWLNTPRRPFEACGTSGMKAAVNGVLHVSVLDGWWCEGYSEERGWPIGQGEEYHDPEYQDAVESQALYNVLENEVIPCFYERRYGDVPVNWVKMMKEAIKMAMLTFCSHRMVGEYEKRFYLPAAKNLKNLVADDASAAKNLVTQHQRLRFLWSNIRVEPPVRDAEGPFRVGESFGVTAVVHLDKISPAEVTVELYYGHMQSLNTLANGFTEEMAVVEDRGGSRYQYACRITCNDSGRYGFSVRVTPRGDSWLRFTPGFITWA
ncbi:MAG: alpha-glucan family phosphorylase [Desulfobacterales bacterium]|nr:alpha-glucan family phosphorylase [Desulfobacterales bacterium]